MKPDFKNMTRAQRRMPLMQPPMLSDAEVKEITRKGAELNELIRQLRKVVR